MSYTREWLEYEHYRYGKEQQQPEKADQIGDAVQSVSHGSAFLFADTFTFVIPHRMNEHVFGLTCN